MDACVFEFYLKYGYVLKRGLERPDLLNII